MAEIQFDRWLVVAQFASPNQRIGQGALNDLYIFRIGRVEDLGQPKNILAIVHIGHLGTVNIERRHGNPAGNVVPITHYILFGLAHGVRTTFYENKSGAIGLVLRHGNLKAAFFVVIPAGYGRLGSLFCKYALPFARAEQRKGAKEHHIKAKAQSINHNFINWPIKWESVINVPGGRLLPKSNCRRPGNREFK